MAQQLAVDHGAHGAHTESAHDEALNIENRKFAMWLFLGSEVMFFTVLIAAYVYGVFMAPQQHAILNIPLTSLNTFLLLSSSFTVVRSLAAVQNGEQTKFLRSLALTIILGAVFLGVQVYEYSHLGHEGLTLSGAPNEPRSIFGMGFFSLTGFHGVHVLIGVVWAIRVFWNAFKGKYSSTNYFGVEFFGLYWHFVDVVWIFIFTVVYLIAPMAPALVPHGGM